ncbi:nesprin-1-like, partial [Stegodyphus dumicola]|uniref:nesprin-1-like n=1 Tax=Stegodyphus dumicola TaxID=202533 RepID=UPI0015ABA6D5
MIKLQMLVNDKLQGEQLLTETIQSGERLYQDTAAPGREIIRVKLRELRDKFDLFSNNVLEVQRQLDALNQHWISFKDTFKQILNWMDNTEKTLASDTANRTAFQDITTHLLKYKALHQETESHKRQLDLLQSKVQSVAPLMKEEDLPLSVLEATARFNMLVTHIKDHMGKTELLSTLYQKCMDLKEASEEWCQKTEEKLVLCSDFSGNRTALKTKEEKLKELKEGLPDGKSKIDLYGESVQKLFSLITPHDFDQLVKGHAFLEKRYEDIITKTDETLREIAEKIKQWETYDEKCSALTVWLENMEHKIKNFSLKTTIEEKIEQRDKFQMLLEDILAHKSTIFTCANSVDLNEQALLSELRAKEANFDVLSDESQELIASSGEIRISMGASQLISRFQSMHLTCKELARKCEQYVDDHLQFNEKYKACSEWIEEAASRYTKINAMPYDNRETLQLKLNQVEELLQSKDTGLNMLSATVQYGEQLQVGSSQDGWETIQAMLQNLQSAFDKIFDDAASLDRSLLSIQFAWTDFEESLQRLQSWVSACNKNFYDSPKLASTLDEKKALLRTYKSLLIDIDGHERAIENLQFSADCLPVAVKDIDQTINALANNHASLKQKSEDYISFYENSVNDHEEFNKSSAELKSLLTATQSSITACNESNLDRISLLSSLQTIKNVIATIPDEKPKLIALEGCLQKVLNSTHQSGHESPQNELKALRESFEFIEASAKDAAESLENLMKQWSDYEERVKEMMAWMKDVESSLQNICLKEGLPEKRAQLEKLKNIQGDIREKELEIDALTDKIHQLHKGPSKRRVSQLSELGIHYQILVSLARDTYTKWNQYVIDHQDFINHTSEFEKTLTEIKAKLEQCQSPEGTLEDVQEKLAIVQ